MQVALIPRTTSRRSRPSLNSGGCGGDCGSHPLPPPPRYPLQTYKGAPVLRSSGRVTRFVAGPETRTTAVPSRSSGASVAATDTAAAAAAIRVRTSTKMGRVGETNWPWRNRPRVGAMLPEGKRTERRGGGGGWDDARVFGDGGGRRWGIRGVDYREPASAAAGAVMGSYEERRLSTQPASRVG